MIRKIVSCMMMVFLSSAAAYADPQTAETYHAGGIAFKVPAGWIQTEPRSSMRLFQFEAPSPKAGEPAVMAVFYFGQDQGGSVDDNIERWKGQFTRTQADAEPAVDKTKMNDVDVTTVYLEGTYDGGMGYSGTKPDYAAFSGSKWTLRMNPSSGNLHPTEGYVICGAIDGLCGTPMVCHYAPKEHGLEVRAEFSVAAPGATLTGVTQHGATKFRDTIAAAMTSAQITEAQRLAREWTPISEVST